MADERPEIDEPPPRFITSVSVERSRGPHEYVSVWIRGAKVGTLCVGEGDGEPLRALLTGDRETLDRIAVAADRVMGIDVIARSPELVEQHAAGVTVFGDPTPMRPPRRPRVWPIDGMAGAALNPEEDFSGAVPGFRSPSTLADFLRSCGEDCCFEPPRELHLTPGRDIDPTVERCVDPFIDPDALPTEAQLQALKRIDAGLTASLRQDMRRLKRQLEKNPMQRAEQMLTDSLAEAGQDVVFSVDPGAQGGEAGFTILTADGREFHVSGELDLDAMNRGRAAVRMPLLERKR